MEQPMRQLTQMLAAGVAAIVLLSASTRVHAAERVTIATDWSPHGMISGLLLAKQKGWFSAAGLDVDVLDGKGSTTTVQQVAAGQLDIGFGQLSSMAAAVANGIPVTCRQRLEEAAGPERQAHRGGGRGGLNDVL
jgi:NitT/TauT family transport system substrate-binding protein